MSMTYVCVGSCQSQTRCHIKSNNSVTMHISYRWHPFIFEQRQAWIWTAWNKPKFKGEKKSIFIKESRCTSCASQNHNWFYQILQPYIQAISPLLFDVYIHNMLKAKLKARFCPQLPLWKCAVRIQCKFNADSELIIKDMWWICEE